MVRYLGWKNPEPYHKYLVQTSKCSLKYNLFISGAIVENNCWKELQFPNAKLSGLHLGYRLLTHALL